MSIHAFAWITGVAIVILHYFSWPIDFHQYNKWMDELIKKRKIITGWTAWWYLWHKRFLFVALGMAATGTIAILLDDAYIKGKITDDYRDGIIIAHFASLVLYQCSVYQWVYWFNSEWWRKFSLSIVLLSVILAEITALVFIILEVVNNDALDTSTEVLVIIGSSLWLAYLLLTFIVYTTYCYNRKIAHKINVFFVYKQSRLMQKTASASKSFSEFTKARKDAKKEADK
jgi:hypothetical protein